jgi:hypothetical protein
MLDFLSGMVAMGFLVAAVFFVRFWKRTGDSLFAIFAASFALLALGQATSTLARAYVENETWLFLLRLAAFLFLLVGILVKNLKEPQRP